MVFPNPTTNSITVEFNAYHNEVKLELPDFENPSGGLVKTESNYTQNDLIHVVMKYVSNKFNLNYFTNVSVKTPNFLDL